MNLTTPTGSLVNNIMANGRQVTPEVGMGATRLSYTDRRPYTIVRVISPKKIEVQPDNFKRVDKNGMSEMQSYEFTPDPTAPTTIVTHRKNGRWVIEGESQGQGTAFLIGERDAYHDFSF